MKAEALGYSYRCSSNGAGRHTPIETVLKRRADFFGLDAKNQRTCLNLLLENQTGVWLDAYGWSMFPASRPGHRLHITRLTRDPKPGEILAVIRGRKVVAHRLVHYDRDSGRLLLKGDTLHWFDACVNLEDVSGLVDRICKNGREVNISGSEEIAGISLWLGNYFSKHPSPGGSLWHLTYLIAFFSLVAWCWIINHSRRS